MITLKATELAVGTRVGFRVRNGVPRPDATFGNVDIGGCDCFRVKEKARKSCNRLRYFFFLVGNTGVASRGQAEFGCWDGVRGPDASFVEIVGSSGGVRFWCTAKKQARASLSALVWAGFCL